MQRAELLNAGIGDHRLAGPKTGNAQVIICIHLNSGNQLWCPSNGQFSAPGFPQKNQTLVCQANLRHLEKRVGTGNSFSQRGGAPQTGSWNCGKYSGVLLSDFMFSDDGQQSTFSRTAASQSMAVNLLSTTCIYCQKLRRVMTVASPLVLKRIGKPEKPVPVPV